MKKSLAVLMDVSLIFLFILISSNYPQSLPHYNPNTFSFFTAGSNKWIRNNNHTTDLSGKYLNSNSINMDQIHSEKAADTLVSLTPSGPFYTPTHTIGDAEPTMGNPNTSLFTLTPIYLIITENVRNRLEK